MWRGLWQRGTQYLDGDLVLDQGKVFRAVRKGGAIWEQVTDDDPDWPLIPNAVMNSLNSLSCPECHLREIEPQDYLCYQCRRRLG